jgi:diguanylate cyclase (GGDEF)-like protein
MGVPLLNWMQPRDREEAAQAVLTLSAAAAFVTVVVAFTAPQQRGGRLVEALVVIPVVCLVIVGAWLLTRSHRDAPLGWAIFPVLTVVVIAVLDVATRDASTAAQVFLTFPALYGASQLPRKGALLLMTASVLADAVVALSLQPARQAIVDIVYVGATIVTSSGLLILAGERRAALMETLRQQAAIDPLTGLATRRVLDHAANSVLAAAHTATGSALLLFDVDHFKSINDQYGHGAGDQALIDLAGVLRLHARADDVVCRMGGDELAMLLPGCSYEVARRRAEKICEDIRQRVFIVNETVELNLSVSAGVAHAPTHADDARSLYAAADGALYDAKRTGRDRVGSLPVMTPVPIGIRLTEPA